ncbi:hypothetical protein EZV62_004062 [Acer yangbiense]|uniref:Uncharacterized protein n=1 Tax=Acer yangbiense TaxID=1000413 RepID=A0A5C7IIF1_9ROSI|nr:hypothetical protein EZV62_004062 [Acer yangbiense]
MVSMVLCLVVGQSTADSYSKCYEDCVVDCLYTKPGKTPQGCMRLCVGQCSGSSGSTLSVHEDDTRYFCNIGRATSVCAKLAAKENPTAAIMASENYVQPSIPRFDGHYDHWSMLMENFLRSKEYWQIIEVGVAEPAENVVLTATQKTELEALKLKDLKAKNYLF